MQEHARFEAIKTLKELQMDQLDSARRRQESLSKSKQAYLVNRSIDEWCIYFDLQDFKKFKKDYPEFLEWLDSPEEHINEMLKADALENHNQIEWDIFNDYHNDVMAFI